MSADGTAAVDAFGQEHRVYPPGKHPLRLALIDAGLLVPASKDQATPHRELGLPVLRIDAAGQTASKKFRKSDDRVPSNEKFIAQSEGARQ